MTQTLDEKINQIEAEMADAHFWDDKDRAQLKIKELQELKLKKEGKGKYDAGNAVLTLLSGAGGDDAEDFSAMLLKMYFKYAELRGWGYEIIHQNENDHGGYRNITVEIKGKNAYGVLKNETGVHRLVRISPFNAKSQRHTSFSLVEVIPKFEKVKEIEINPDDLKIEFTRSSGPGGQNVNKRETAVRIVHIPTKISVHIDSERSQAQNKELAMNILQAKLFRREEERRKKEEKGMQVAATTDIEWGNQIRSYVLHPYKMVKDHRTDFETSNVDAVLNGEIQDFIDAEKDL